MLKRIIVVNTATCVEGIDHEVIPRDDGPRSLVLNENDSVHVVEHSVKSRKANQKCDVGMLS
jgi:hypothetical protein